MNIRSGAPIIALALGIAGSTGSCAAHHGAPAPASPSVSATAMASADPEPGVAAADTTAGKVTKHHCRDWAQKFAHTTNVSVRASSAKCDDKLVAIDPKRKGELRQIGEQLVEVVERQGGELEKGCETQVGKTFIPDDAQCFMRAKVVDDWARCNFTTPFFEDFRMIGSMLVRVMEERCAVATASPKPSASGSASTP